MDLTEDLSARVLLKNILSTEPPRTPITRSSSKVQSSSGSRRSSRLSRKDAGGQTPQDILRRSLKHKVRESITRKSLPATSRRTATVVLRRINTPASASVLLDDGDTPRHILRNILRTEPVKSPVVHEKAASEEPQLPSANSITSKRPSMELSGLDLPDLTISNAASIAKGLSRKRPRRSLNVTAFEKRLKDGNDVEEENEESIGEHSSLSLSSNTSLSLKTPFVDVRTEKRGLQRRVSNRRKITEEEFGAAVNKRQMDGGHGVSGLAPVERVLSQTAYSEGFTLGLSQLTEPDITIDIVNCNTALYTQPDAMTSSLSIVAMQDKPTVMASQLQRQMTDMEQMETDHSKLEKEKSVYVFPTEEGVVAETQIEESEPQSEEKVDVAVSKPEEVERVSKDTAESEEEENRVETQTEEECAVDPQTESGGASRSQSEEEEVVPDSQTEGEEEGGVDSQPEDDVVPDSQTEEEQDSAAESQTEEGEEGDEADSQPEEDVVPDSQTEEEQEGAAELQTEEEEEDEEEEEEEEEHGVGSQSEDEGDVGESQTEDERDGKQEELEEEEEEEEELELASGQLGHDLEHISRRAHRSEGGLIMPVTGAGEDLADATEAGWSEGRSKAHSAVDDLHSSLETRSRESSQLHSGTPDLAQSATPGQKDASCTEAEPDADKENSFHLLQMTHDIEDGGHLSHASPKDAADQDAAEQEEEWEDEEDSEESEVFPCKTPAFVREKRNFFHADPLASPSVLKNIQAISISEALPAAKPKQVRQRRRAPAQKEAGLPRSYLMNTFKHFAKTKVSADVYPVLKDIMDKFFERLADDLETYAGHAKRKTIEVEDAELLLRRQGYVNEKVPVEVLIEKYLRMDQRKLLIPIATSGNVVIPKKRR